MPTKTPRAARTKKTASSRRSTPSKAVSRGRGVAAPAARSAATDADGRVDGCDVDFATAALTADADLPPAKGGVEPAPRGARRK